MEMSTCLSALVGWTVAWTVADLWGWKGRERYEEEGKDATEIGSES